ncbi:MAG TPA: CHRD domain-containing protein [Gemmatimonadaceae bacterium]|nr:CHRD domain-containing protein [Gemmatimonadaceae bacterium]
MTSRSRTVLASALVLAGACSAERAVPTSTELRIPLYETSQAANNLGTHLDGRDEVPVHLDTRAQGQAIFRVSDDGMSVDYTLIASNIDNPFMAHIHLGPAGVVAPIVEWLYPSTAVAPGPLGSGRHDGILAQGTFTAANLVGPLAGHPLSDLLAAMRTGGAYVNVHTNDGVGAVNTGPGDFPGGEIRGQLSQANLKQ